MAFMCMRDEWSRLISQTKEGGREWRASTIPAEKNFIQEELENPRQKREQRLTFHERMREKNELLYYSSPVCLKLLLVRLRRRIRPESTSSVSRGEAKEGLK